MSEPKADFDKATEKSIIEALSLLKSSNKDKDLESIDSLIKEMYATSNIDENARICVAEAVDEFMKKDHSCRKGVATEEPAAILKCLHKVDDDKEHMNTYIWGFFNNDDEDDKNIAEKFERERAIKAINTMFGQKLPLNQIENKTEDKLVQEVRDKIMRYFPTEK